MSGVTPFTLLSFSSLGRITHACRRVAEKTRRDREAMARAECKREHARVCTYVSLAGTVVVNEAPAAVLQLEIDHKVRQHLKD